VTHPAQKAFFERQGSKYPGVDAQAKVVLALAKKPGILMVSIFPYEMVS
jgi:hypothetical protein